MKNKRFIEEKSSYALIDNSRLLTYCYSLVVRVSIELIISYTLSFFSGVKNMLLLFASMLVPLFSYSTASFTAFSTNS